MLVRRSNANLSLFLLFSTCLARQVSPPMARNDVPGLELTVPQMIESWGYPVEEHVVTTEDGYLLTMHRITSGRKSENDHRTPVFLGHCLMCSSAVFAFGPPENSLAYILADAGYDVWLGNTRGNTWSRAHVSLEPCPTCSQFWDFSFDESGRFDYAAEIDHILSVTGFSDLFFVGYSMGTTQYLVLLSERPEFNAKVRAGFLLGPVAFLQNANENAQGLIGMLGEGLLRIHDEQIGYEMMPMTAANHYLAKKLCSSGELGLSICAALFSAITRVGSEKLNSSMLPTYLHHLPAGSSTRTVKHFAQIAGNGGKFTRFDYGNKEENLKHYGDVGKVPEYNLTKVITPTSMYVGSSDRTASAADAALLAARLPNLVEYVTVEDFAHCDFFAAKNAASSTFSRILAKMDELNR